MNRIDALKVLARELLLEGKLVDWERQAAEQMIKMYWIDEHIAEALVVAARRTRRDNFWEKSAVTGSAAES